MKYLWIGVGNSPENKNFILQNGGKILSDSVSNDSLITGLDAVGVECDSINCPNIPPYPEYPIKRIDNGNWSRTGRSNDCFIGYSNLKYINILSKKNAMKKAAQKWAKDNKNEEVTVFVYQMASRFMAAAAEVKKIIPSAKICLIVPDLPQYMDMNMSRLKKFLKRIDWQNIKKYQRSVDKYVLYSKHMAEFLKLSDGQYIVMEGSYDPSIITLDEPKKENDKKSVMYSGVLDLRYGVRELLNAVSLLDDSYELWLTGDGNAVPIIEEIAKNDDKIKYFGYLPSRMELLKKQKEATMLISPRSTDEEASKYCFPSKIFEYMVSGNPVISTKIGGIPDEYFKYLVPIEKINAEEIASAIKYIGDMPKSERAGLGNSGKKFILDNKNNVAQVKHILDFLGG
jgi:glycosyltransferase involved in cell wall biosynthesis